MLQTDDWWIITLILIGFAGAAVAGWLLHKKHGQK